MIENLVHTEVKIGDESLDTLEENKRSEEKVAPVVLASQYDEKCGGWWSHLLQCSRQAALRELLTPHRHKGSAGTTEQPQHA